MAARDHWFDNARIHALLPELATLEEDDARCFARIATRRVMRPAAMRTAAAAAAAAAAADPAAAAADVVAATGAPAAAPAGFVAIVILSAVHALGCALCCDCGLADGGAAGGGDDAAGGGGHATACAAWRLLSRACLACFMVGAAALRLDRRAVVGLLLPIVPPPLPPRLCVYASGVMDAVAALLLLLPGGERLGATLVLTMLALVFPANLYHALSAKAQARTRIGPPAVYVRLPIQALFAAWARWHVL